MPGTSANRSKNKRAGGKHHNGGRRSNRRASNWRSGGKRAGSRRRLWWAALAFLLLAVVLLFAACWSVRTFISRDERRSVLPKIEISLNDVTLDEIKDGSKEIKYSGNQLQIEDKEVVKSFSDVVIKGRGNGTWRKEKKPFQIKFGSKVDLFGLGAARKWYLLANYLDDTQIRTDLVFFYNQMLGSKYAFTDGQFVEVFFDGEYEGLYYLTRAVEIAKDRVDLREPDGLLVEMDNLYYNDEDEYYETDGGNCLIVKDSVNDDREREAMGDFLEQFNKMERAISDGDFAELSAVADVDSLAEYYILSEFTNNPDAFVTSVYFYRDGTNDKIHAGPGWDFDLAFANNKWGVRRDGSYLSSTELMKRKIEKNGGWIFDESQDDYVWAEYPMLADIYFGLMEMPEFRARVEKIYQERLLGRKDELINYLWKKANLIADYALRDAAKWEKEDFWDGINSLSKWVSDRYDYLDYVFGAGGLTMPEEDLLIKMPWLTINVI